MNLSATKAKHGLSATAAHTSTNVTGSARVGPADLTRSLPTANVIYSLTGIVCDGADLEVDLTTGDATASTAWVAGNAQVESVDAVGTITLAGDATVTVTAAGLTGSPLAITFPVALADTAALWRAKCIAALSANAAVSAMFLVGGGSSPAIILARKPKATLSVTNAAGLTTTKTIYHANDATLNIALADDTSTGITEDTTSTDSVAGVATSGCYIFDGDAKDFEGTTVPAIALVNAIDIRTEASTGGYAEIVQTGDTTIPASIPSGSALTISNLVGYGIGTPVFSPDGADCLITITATGATA